MIRDSCNASQKRLKGPLSTTCGDDRALSSAVEHFLDMEGVTGSIPVAPTIKTPRET